MIVTSVKTHKITTNDKDIRKILDRYLPPLAEKSIVAVTSKIVAICEGRTAEIKESIRDEIVKKEAEYYLPKEENKWGFYLTITHGIMIASAGVDESNGNGRFVLWPKDPQISANEIRRYLAEKMRIRPARHRKPSSRGVAGGDVGVIITDSRILPLRRGTTGTAIAHRRFFGS